MDYIHLNPVRASLTDAALIQKYPWTSLNGFSKIETRPKFMDCRWMSYVEGLSDTPNGWRRYAKLLAMRNSDDPKEIESLDRRMCRGWCIGAEEFRKTVSEDFLEKEGAARLEKQGLRDFNEARWETGLEVCMKALEKNSGDAAGDAMSTDWKLAIACRLKLETSVTNAWLGQQLNMGAPRSVSAICGRYAKQRNAKCPYYLKLSNLTIDY